MPNTAAITRGMNSNAQSDALPSASTALSAAHTANPPTDPAPLQGSRWKTWLKRGGKYVFWFYFIKGIAWLVVPGALAWYASMRSADAGPQTEQAVIHAVDPALAPQLDPVTNSAAERALQSPAGVTDPSRPSNSVKLSNSSGDA